MTEVLGQAAGIRVELDVERLGGLISKQVAEQLAALFPSEPGEFWAALCDQAYRERQRVGAMLDLACPHRDQCPHKPDVLAGIHFEGESDGPGTDRSESAAGAVDTGAGHQRHGVVAGRKSGRRTATR